MRVTDIIGNGSEWIPNPSRDSIKPLVTVIFPAQSGAKSGLFKKNIDAILAQSFRRLELIIVADNSADGTPEICKEYMDADSRVNTILHKCALGLPTISVYEAYKKARGEYISVAVDAMIWESDALARTYDFMEENGVKACYGVTRIKDPVTRRTIELGKNVETVKNTLWAGNCIGAGSVVLHKEVLETVGLFDPHLAVSGVYDWDLWLRISEWYDFVGTGILFAKKHGASPAEENNTASDMWLVRERQQHRDLSLLLPENFGRTDVTAYTSQSSTYYMRGIRECYSRYGRKNWFSAEEYAAFCNASGCSAHRHITVCTHACTASIMNFTRHQNPNLTVSYVLGGEPPHAITVLTDAVVVVRQPDMQPINSLCRKLHIPCYYFVDDNFREIVVDQGNDLASRDAAVKTNRKCLSQYAAVLVTTPALKEYFLKKNLHDHVILLPAVWRKPCRESKETKTLTIAFMGGAFREGTLKNCVLPALRHIAKERPLRLICPCTKKTEKQVRELGNSELEILPFYRTNNYEFLMNTYAALNPDILIHCGNNLRNNIYKTKNALINAVTLGVPLLTSDIEPYCDFSDGSENAYFLTRNTPEEWEKSLRQLIEDPALRHTLFARAESFCKKNYSSEATWTEMNQELETLPVYDAYFYVKRYEQLCNWLLSPERREKTEINGKGWRVYIPEELSYTGALEKTRRFGFTSSVSTIREVGLLFAVTGDCTGTVELAFYKHGQTEPETVSVLDIDQLVENAYTDILLDKPISVEPDERLFVDITVRYNEKNGFVGLFEDRKRRTFIYKVFNKLHCPIPGRDAIFIDCRS